MKKRLTNEGLRTNEGLFAKGSQSPSIRRAKHPVSYLVDAGLLVATPAKSANESDDSSLSCESKNLGNLEDTVLSVSFPAELNSTQDDEFPATVVSVVEVENDDYFLGRGD